jgi:DNA-binding XRE family transcriptional regulator
MKSESQRPRLCWTRTQLLAATGLSYRTLINLEKRGLLQRIMIGINVACYSDASVQALFNRKSGKKEDAV